MGLPECAWDAGLGLVVLYCRAGAPAPGYSLVVAPTAGTPAWYAGDWPAGEPLWAVRAPSAGSFRLLFYTGGKSPANLLAEPPALPDGNAAAVAFDERLRVDPARPPGPRARYAGWLMHGGGRGVFAPQSFTVGPEENLYDVLATLGWDGQDGLGVTAARLLGEGPGAVRGPAMHPLRPTGTTIPVHFTLVPDPTPPAADGVLTPAFADLHAPAIAVDLTAFGAEAETLRAGFWFFHHPHGPERGVAHWPGADVPLLQDEHGRRYLLWSADDACHLDLIGLYFAGGPLLVVQPDPALPLTGADAQAGGSDCLLALFHGEARLLSAELAAPYAALGREYCIQPDLTALALARDAAWVGAGGQAADWRGAGSAEAFTLAAFLRVLAGVPTPATPVADDVPLAAALAPHGLTTLADFRLFAGRPDLTLALVAEPRLRALLARTDSPPGALLAPRPLAPVAVLAAALGSAPADAGLGAWVEAAGPAVQRALWLWLLAGGSAGLWRDLALPPALAGTPDGACAEPARLAALAARLKRAMRPDPAGALAATAHDLDARLPALPLRRLEDALARADALERVDAVLAAEVDMVNTDLEAAAPGRRLAAGAVMNGFAAALGSGGVAPRDALRRRLLSTLAGCGPAVLDLSAAVTDLRTRAVLWALADLLGVATRPDDAGPFAGIGFTPAAGGAAEPAAAGLWFESAADGPVLSPLDLAGGLAPTPVAGAAAAAMPPSVLARAPAPAQVPDDKLLLTALHWCLRVLRLEAPDWPPPAEPDGALALDQTDAARLGEECASLLADLDAFWGLADPAPVPPPRWTGARATAARAHQGAIAGNGWQVRQALQPIATRPAAAPVLACLDRVVAAREVIAADRVWTAVRAAADGIGADPGALGTRLGLAAPADWPALADEVDRLTTDHGNPANTVRK